MTNVGNIDNCYKYIYKNLLFFIFLLLMVSDLGSIQVAYANFPNDPVDTDITSAFGYDYGNDNAIKCHSSINGGTIGVDEKISEFRYVSENNESLSYETSGFTSKFFKCVDSGFIVSGNFSGQDYAPCNENFNYEKYKNKLNYISFNKDSGYHLFVIANSGQACELSKIKSEKTIKTFNDSSITGGCAKIQDEASCGRTGDTVNSCYVGCYDDNHDCVTLTTNSVLPKYVVTGESKPTDGTEYNEFYVFKKNNTKEIEKNRSTFPGQVYNCYADNNKNFYLPTCDNENSDYALYKSGEKYDEYLQVLNSNTNSDTKCLVSGSDISYCSDLKDGNLKYKYGFGYDEENGNQLNDGVVNCFLKSCVDVTEKEWGEINTATGAKGKFCSEYRYLVNSNGLKYFPKDSLMGKSNNAVYCSDLDANGNLVFPSGQNKNKDNCYLKRCIALSAEERRKIILANLDNFDRKIARIDYENNIFKGTTQKYRENNTEKETTIKLSQPVLLNNDTKYSETIKYAYHYNSNSSHFESMMKKQDNTDQDLSNIKQDLPNIKQGLSKYCEDEVFFVNGTLDKFDDLLLNVVSCNEGKLANVNSTSFTDLFINKDLKYSLNNKDYNTNTKDVYCRTPITPVYKNGFEEIDSFVCNVVITKNENENANINVFTENNDIFPDCSIKKEGDTTTVYGTYDRISIKDIDIGKDYNNIIYNIDNTLLFLNAEILDLDKSDKYSCTAMSFDNEVDINSCKITEDNGYDFKSAIQNNGSSGLPQCSLVKYEDNGEIKCEEKDKVYELDLLKSYNIPSFSKNSSSIINSKNNTEKSIEKFLVDINNYNIKRNDINYTHYVNYQEKDGNGEYVIKDSFFDCGLYALIDFDKYNKTSDVLCYQGEGDKIKVCDNSGNCQDKYKYNVYYNNFTYNREFKTLIDRIRTKCKSKYLPLNIPVNSILYDAMSANSLYNKQYGQKPLKYDLNGLSESVGNCDIENLLKNDSEGKAFGCYSAKKGTNTHFCKIPKDESFYIGEYRTLNGYEKNACSIGTENESGDGCANGNAIKPEKPAYVRLQVSACIRHPNDVFSDNQLCGERGGSNIQSRCITLDSNYIEDIEESETDKKIGGLKLIKDYVTNKELDGDSRDMLYNVSIDGTNELAGMYDLTAKRSNSNFFRTDRYGRDVYVFYDFATNYMCTTANEEDHRDYYAIAVVFAECFGIGLVGGLTVGIVTTVIASPFVSVLAAVLIGAGAGGIVGLTGFGICEGIRVGGGEADFTFSNDLFYMKDYYDDDIGDGFYSNLNITNNNNVLYNYYRRSDNIKEDLKYKLEGSNKNYAGAYGDGNVLSKKIIEKCELQDFVVRERVCWDGSEYRDDKECRYADWSMNKGSGENYQYLIQNYNADFSDKNLKCKYKYFNKNTGLGCNENYGSDYKQMCVISINEDNTEPMLSCFNKPENCLTEKQKKCLKEYGVHFFTNAQKLMDKSDYNESNITDGKNYGGINYLDFLKGYGDGYFTRAAYGTLNYDNGIVAINMVETAQNAVSESNTKKDCVLDKFGNPIGDLQKCRGYSYCEEYGADNKTCANNSEVFVKENQSIKIGLQTSPQPFFTIANPNNTYDLFRPFLELIAYYPSDVKPNNGYTNSISYTGYDFKLNLFNPILLFKYDFPGADDNFKNTYTKRCFGKNEVIGQDCGEIWAEIPFDKNMSPIYNLKYKSRKSGNRIDNFYFILSKEFTINGNGVEVPTVCLHQLEQLPSNYNADFGVFKEAEDGTKYAMKERNVFCYDRKYPSINNIAMKPVKDFSYKNPYINVINVSVDDTDILSRFDDDSDVYLFKDANDNSGIQKGAKNSVQNLAFTFRRNECTRVENDYYMDQFKINNKDSYNLIRDDLIYLEEDIGYIKNAIKPHCDLQNGSPYYVVNADRKYKLKKNYGAYGGFNEMCLSNVYVKEIKNVLNINYDIVAYQQENSVEGKCFLDRVSRINDGCLVSSKVYAICTDIYGPGNTCNVEGEITHAVDGKINVISVIDSNTGESTNIVEIDCKAFLEKIKSGEDNYAKNNPLLYINKMKACYKGGYNSAGNIYTDKNKYKKNGGTIELVNEVKVDYSCSCMKKIDGNSDYKNLKTLMGEKFSKYFAYRKPTARELSLCVDLINNPKCESVEYRTVGGIYVDSNMSVPEQEYSSMKILKEDVNCYPNMSCSNTNSEKYNAGLNQHFWRTSEKLFGVLSPSVYGSLGHSEFESTLYCEHNKDLCIDKNSSNVTGLCNGYWKVNNTAPVAVCKIVNCNNFEDDDEKAACKKRYDSVDDDGYALDENGDYVYEYDLDKTKPGCVRYRCPGMFSDIKESLNIDGDVATYNTIRTIVTDEFELSTNTAIVKDSVTDGEISIYDRTQKKETDFRDVIHFIDYSNGDIDIDQRGRSHGFAVWTNTDENGNVIDDTESSDIVKLVTADRCLTGYAPAGTNYNRETLLDNIINNNDTVEINGNTYNYQTLVESIDDINLYCQKIPNGSSIIYNCDDAESYQDFYKELIKLQVNYINNSTNIIDKNKLPQRYCGQKGNWLDTRDIYSNIPSGVDNILYYSGNETWLDTLLKKGYLKGSNTQLFNTTTDGIFNKTYNESDEIGQPTGDYMAGYITKDDSNRYCERLFCPDINIDRYKLNEDIEQVEYDIYGIEKRDNIGTTTGDFDNKIYNYTDQVVLNDDINNKMTRYTTWRHTAGATWENIAAPRNDSSKLCIGDTNCSDIKNIQKILEDRGVPSGEDGEQNTEDKNINKFLKKVRGICQTEYGYYERNSKFYGDDFKQQLDHIQELVDDNYKVDVFGSLNDIDNIDSVAVSSDTKIYEVIPTHSVDPRKVSLQQENLENEKIDSSGISKKPSEIYAGIEPIRTCNSAGIWSGVSDGCFRACEMLDLYNVKVSPEISKKRFDSAYRYDQTQDMKKIDTNLKPVYVKNSDIKAIQFFNQHNTDSEQNYRNIYNLIAYLRTNKNLTEVEKTQNKFTYGDYLTGGAMWPRTIVNLTDSTLKGGLYPAGTDNDKACGEVECIELTEPHEGYDGTSETQREHCEIVRCDSNGRRLRYIEVSGECDSTRFRGDKLGEDAEEDNKFENAAINYVQNATMYNNGSKPIIPIRRCYEDGVWGPVYGPTRCVLQRTCKPLYFNPKNLYYLIYMYDYLYKTEYNKNNLIEVFEEYIKNRNDNINLIKDLIFRTQDSLTNIMSNSLIFVDNSGIEFKDEINLNNENYTSKDLTNYTMGVLKNSATTATVATNAYEVGKFEAINSLNNIYSDTDKSYKDGYDLYCNLSGGGEHSNVPWMVAYYDDTELNNICKNSSSSMSNSYDCAINADLGEMIKPLVCSNKDYEDMRNNSTIKGIANRLKHKVLRDSNNSNCQGLTLSDECKKTKRLNVSGKEIKSTDIEMYVKTSYLQEVYEELKTDGKGDTYQKEYYKDGNGNNLSNELENESMKNITIGTHEYLSFQGHTKCDEDYFYNSKLLDKKYDIDDYQVVYECRVGNDNKPVIGFPSEDLNLEDGKIISPADCEPKYCGQRSGFKAHNNWTVSHVGEVGLNTGKYGYQDSNKLPQGKEQVSSLKCKPGYAFVIKDINNIPVAVGENGNINNDIYKKKINSGTDSSTDDPLRYYMDRDIVDYYKSSGSDYVSNGLDVDSNAIEEQAKRGGWITSINLGCYMNNYDIEGNQKINNDDNLKLDRTFGKLRADGIDYNTEITFCKDIAQTNCQTLKLTDTFNDGFLEDSYYNKENGYCVYMGCRFNDIEFIYLNERESDGTQKKGTINDDGQTKLSTEVTENFTMTKIINNYCNDNSDDCKKNAKLKFGAIFAVGGESKYDTCNYKTGNTSGSCQISERNLCPSGYDQYTKGKEEPISYEEYIFSGKSNKVNDTEIIDSSGEEYNVCRQYVASATLENKETTASGGNPNGSIEDKAKYYNNHYVDSVSYNDDYINFVAKYSELNINLSYTLTNDNIKALDKRIVEHWNGYDGGAFKNKTVWNACTNIKYTGRYSTNVYTKAYRKEKYYGDYYKYELEREGDNNYVVLLNKTDENLDTNGVKEAYGYFLGRENHYQYTNISNCYEETTNGIYGFRYKFDNLNSVDYYGIDKTDVIQYRNPEGEISHYFCTYKNCFGNEVKNSSTGQCDNSINSCKGTTFNTIKNKYNSITTDCIFATNSPVNGGSCDYNEDLKTYQKLDIMRGFLSNSNNLNLYKTLINEHIEDEFGSEYAEGKSKDRLIDYFTTDTNTGIMDYITTSQFYFEFTDDTKLYTCYIQQYIKIEDGQSLPDMKDYSICIETNVNNLTQKLVKFISQESKYEDLTMESLGSLDSTYSNDNSDFKKLQEYTKILYNDFFDYNEGSEIKNYTLNENKKGIINLKNKINNNCNKDSHLASAYETYYNDVKRNNYKFEQQGIEVNSGFYTLFRCDLKTGKIKTIGWDNEEMVCAKRCNGVPTNNSDENNRYKWYYLNPQGTGKFYYRFKNIKNLRHSEKFIEYIYAREESGKDIDSHNVNLSCNNGVFEYTRVYNSMSFKLKSSYYRGNLKCFFGDKNTTNIYYEYYMTKAPYVMICYKYNDYKAIRSRRKYGEGKGGFVENTTGFNYPNSAKHPYLTYDMDIWDASDSGLTSKVCSNNIDDDLP